MPIYKQRLTRGKLLRKRESYCWVVEESPQFADATYMYDLQLSVGTKAGMTSATESITNSLQRTRQLMVQEVERSASTLMTESTGVLKKAESEYKGHRSLLMRTRNLLSTMQRQDVLDRVILAVGFFLFSCVVLYVVSKRFGILKLQQKVTAAIKAGMVGQAKIGGGAVANCINDNAVRRVDVPLDRPMRDEL